MTLTVPGSTVTVQGFLFANSVHCFRWNLWHLAVQQQLTGLSGSVVGGMPLLPNCPGQRRALLQYQDLLDVAGIRQDHDTIFSGVRMIVVAQ
jgi:hypothetical protein